MSQKLRTRLHVVQSLIEDKMLINEAAVVLDLSERQVIRLKKGVMEQGDAFVIHKNKGRKPKHAITDDEKQLVVQLKNSKYQEANFSHFQELLSQHEAIFLSQSTIHRILTIEGIKSPKKHSHRKVHRRRKRKAQEGMLIQIDASPHEWIIGGEKFTLHGAIDDATGKIVALFFTKNECLEAYFEIIRQIIIIYGIPIAIYADRHTIFLSPKYGKLTIEEELAGKTVNDTQFGRALKELGINLIAAKSPQAKGRIERLWETLQSRLPVEFKIAGIDSLEAANVFLQNYMGVYNLKFAVAPEESEPTFRTLPENMNLDHILCLKHTRQVDHGSVFSFNGELFQLVKKGRTIPVIPKAKVTVLVSSKIGVLAQYSGSVYHTFKVVERSKKSTPVKSDSPSIPKGHKPSSDHYWRQYDRKSPNTFLEETDREILDALFNSSCAWR